MDFNSFERTNLCYITPCTGCGQMLHKTSVTESRKYSCSFPWINIV